MGYACVRYGNAETVTKYWTCLVCHKELKCQKGIIIQHLLNVHSLELIDYERQYMDASDQVRPVTSLSCNCSS
jgi:hypothetical protein